MPRLGAKYDIETEKIEKPKDEYMTDEYFELDLPVAPAVMVGEEIVVEGIWDSPDRQRRNQFLAGLPENSPVKLGA